MSARRTGLLGVLFFLAVTPLLFSLVRDAGVLANHDGHLKAAYFVLPFIDDVTNNPLALVPVYDCAGQGHTHEDIIDPAVAAWNATDRVQFAYVTGWTTPCDAEGFPTADGQLGVLHTSATARADHTERRYGDLFRDDDVGPEGETGMYPLRVSRIRMNSAYHSTAVLVHELGHAAGLSDLYVEESSPCEDGHTHNPDTTIMDCTVGNTKGQHDIDNVDLLYRRAPEQVGDFTIDSTTLAHDTTASVSFEWTDTSYTEQFQYIAIDNNQDGVGEGFPLPAARDAESVTWAGLQPGTDYCFFIQPGNAYGVFATRSSHACITTPSPPLQAPASMASAFPSTSVHWLAWTTVPAAGHYHVCTDFSPNGAFDWCSGPIGGNLYNAGMPTLDRVPVYNKVKACVSLTLDLCSYLSDTFTVSERVDVGGWDYAFTFYAGPAPAPTATPVPTPPASTPPPTAGPTPTATEAPVGGIAELAVANPADHAGNLVIASRGPRSNVALQEGEVIHVQFVNFMNNLFALKLHIRDGTSTSSPLVGDDTECIPVNTVSEESIFEPASFTSGFLGAQGHDLLDAGRCDSVHTNDSPYIGSGAIPP